MTFLEMLRKSRNSRVAVLHEFLTQYNPSQPRIHAFFEGHDDVAFFSYFIERCAPSGSRLYVYRCEGKPRVYDVFNGITDRHPGARSVLFFVDKDLDDILGTAWPTDPRIFVTDAYSVENYLVTRSALERLYRDAVRLTDVTFDVDLLFAQFERELNRFHRRMLALMSWILVSRRLGERPNLSNLDLSRFYRVTDSCEFQRKAGARVQQLSRITGVQGRSNSFRAVSAAARELDRLPAKRFVRGKFEAWFFVEFWKSALRQLRVLAREGGGNISVKLTLEHSNVCATMKSYCDFPRGLELFLGAHFPGSPQVTPMSPGSRWIRRIREFFSLGIPLTTLS